MSDDRSEIWQEVFGWLRIAQSDQWIARLCHAADPPLRDVAAYDCPQAAEKLLKGFLVEAGHSSKPRCDRRRRRRQMRRRLKPGLAGETGFS